MSDRLPAERNYDLFTFSGLFLAPLEDFSDERRGIAACVDIGKHDTSIWRELEASNVIVPCRIGRREDRV